MREIIFFIASLAGAAILTAVAVLLAPQSPFWKFILWGGIGVFAACATVLLIDYLRPGGNIFVLSGLGVGITLAVGFSIAVIAGYPQEAEESEKSQIIVTITRFETSGWPPNTAAVVFDLLNRGPPSIMTDWELSLVAPTGARLDRLAPTHFVTTRPVNEFAGGRYSLKREDNSVVPLASGAARNGCVFSYTHNSALDASFYGPGVHVYLNAKDVWGHKIEASYVTP